MVNYEWIRGGYSIKFLNCEKETYKNGCGSTLGLLNKD